jgi:hypothetical protein
MYDPYYSQANTYADSVDDSTLLHDIGYSSAEIQGILSDEGEYA